MVVDYEAAWIELQQEVAGKSQHGRDGLLLAMTQIAARHRVAAGELSRVLRLYSIETERLRLVEMDTDPDTTGRLATGLASVGDGVRPGHHDPGGHDGRFTAGRRGADG